MGSVNFYCTPKIVTLGLLYEGFTWAGNNDSAEVIIEQLHGNSQGCSGINTLLMHSSLGQIKE